MLITALSSIAGAAVIFDYDFSSDPTISINGGLYPRFGTHMNNWLAGQAAGIVTSYDSVKEAIVIDSSGTTWQDSAAAFAVKRGDGSGLVGNDGATLDFGTTYKVSFTINYDTTSTDDDGGVYIYTFDTVDNTIDNNLAFDLESWSATSGAPPVSTQLGAATQSLVYHQAFSDTDTSGTYTANITLSANQPNAGIMVGAYAMDGAIMNLEQVTMEAIPEPATVGLTMMGFLGLMVFRRLRP